jgi:NAD(P)-dependent dehydrogenase (short-subunit alcohol dehydrogenase family)
MEFLFDLQTVLIITSGLGLELVKLYLDKGFQVVATGRHSFEDESVKSRVELFNVDFSDLNQTAEGIKKICGIYNFDLVINNAGVLGPPHFIITGDGLEYTFQVNFLSHLLVNEMIIRNKPEREKLMTAAVTSPVYRIARPDMAFSFSERTYRPLKAYSDSKLLLAMMCSHLSERNKGSGSTFISFNPGVFSSGIFRMQRQWFRIMYKIGAPFMMNPGKAALTLAKTIEREDLVNGSIYDLKGRVRSVQAPDDSISNNFWKECYSRIEQFL